MMCRISHEGSLLWTHWSGYKLFTTNDLMRYNNTTSTQEMVKNSRTLNYFSVDLKLQLSMFEVKELYYNNYQSCLIYYIHPV